MKKILSLALVILLFANCVYADEYTYEDESYTIVYDDDGNYVLQDADGNYIAGDSSGSYIAGDTQGNFVAADDKGNYYAQDSDGNYEYSIVEETTTVPETTQAPITSTYNNNYYYYYDNDDGAIKYSYPESAWWSGYYAVWSVAGAATKAQVRLYRNGMRITTQDTTNHYYNFGNYIRQEGTYFYEVRTRNKYEGWSSWVTSDTMEWTYSYNPFSEGVNSNYSGIRNSTQRAKGAATQIIPSGTSGTTSGTVITPIGTWEKINNFWFYKENGQYVMNDWRKVSDKWYYFNSAGAMCTGWQSIGGKIYYFTLDGDMVTGVKLIDGVTRSFDANGALIG